jgi:glycosyltransferase involved in cell wall biosynthesis
MEAKKTILLFIDWYLPGYKAGGPIQSCANLVNHLKDKYHFLIVTRDTDYCETKPYPSVKSNAWNVVEENVHIYYFGAKNLNKNNIFKLIKGTKFDQVYLNGIFSFYFTIVPLLYFRKNKHRNVVLATRGMLASGALALKGGKKQLFLKAAKWIGLFKNVIFHATSEAEQKDIITTLGNSNQIKIAGNLSKKIALASYQIKQKEKGALKLFNIARVAPEKNLKFALEILYEVKSSVCFDFYGPVYDEAYYEICKHIISQLPTNIIVNYKGVIPNTEVNEALKQYHAMLMPTLGENFGHIILESLIAACPVIISDQTPWQNLEKEQAGWSIPLLQKQKFIESIELLANCSQEEFNIYTLGAYQKSKAFIENKALIASNSSLFE